MMGNNVFGSKILEVILNGLDLPDYAYEKAQNRYQDLGKWFSRKESSVEFFEPHIFPQGSFRIGTAIRPLSGKEDYDLDLVCKLQEGYYKADHTQKELKVLIGRELEIYRSARTIEEPLEEKHRCWCLEYKDTLGFHMDIVPCIPEDEEKIRTVNEAIRAYRESKESLSAQISRLTVSITDDRTSNYRNRGGEWPVSNPEGYALWFENRMNQGVSIAVLERAKIDDVPLFARKTILQKAVQILKRHRDKFFSQANAEDRKPASIILTTLAARAYQGEQLLPEAISRISSQMESYISRKNGKACIPNPVNPEENFADKWSMPQYAKLDLEGNFYTWLTQARKDFENILCSSNPNEVFSKIDSTMGISVSGDLVKRWMEGAGKTIVGQPSRTIVYPKPSDPPKPWGIA